ncbi:hypothetical protein [Polaribacter ponticola]|uniref:PLD phosphodiesterase domain-containing protein n=1 Tax=Polaribacter ponticola TaxID=2978475 RepID=A0ABT5S953_9FLAO|nr:hypothetical protein [Polaribacter sp. MSW5]MDD7914115.1 hypothetical protein [Polaribacter sp. MSW5]
MDSENGLLPYNFKNNFVQFSDWSDVLEKNNKNSIQRLHAKAIQIEYDEETIFILGSANATLEAFGISKRAVVNQEAIIILKSKKRTDFFKDLGINFPKIGFLKPTQFIKRTLEDNVKQSNSIKIKHSELEEDNLIINLKEIKSEKFLLQTFDNNENILEQINILIDKSVLKCKLKKVETVFKFAFYEINSLKRVSNFSLIQRTSILKKSNPDERLAKLQSFEFLDIFNTLNYELVLDFLDSEKVFQNQSKTMSILPLSDNDEDDDGEVITESEYNTNAMLGIDEFVTKDNITSMIEEFLDVLKIRDTQIDELSNNNEELAIEAGDDGLNSQINLDNQRRSINTKEGQRIQNKIANTVKSVTCLIDERFQKNIQQDERSIKALFIGFHILLHFWKEGYSEDISVIKIKYRNIEELSVLEKKFSLVRLESQITAIRNEVLYNIEYLKLHLFEDFVKNQKHVNITSTPTEPISNFNSFINDKFINSYLDTSLIASFLNKGLLTILWSIKTEELKINKEETVKLIILTNKYLSEIKGSKHFVNFRKLILLNMFDLFNLETFELNNASEDMKEVLNSELFIYYKAFKEQLKLKQIISKKLESYLTNSIIYSTRYGFCRLKMVRKNFYIDIENPLGEYIKHGDYLGSFKVYVGENVKIFG